MMRLLLRLAFAFEPLAPTAISYFLVRYLHVWEQQGIVSNYRAHTRRLGKFHYKVEIEVEVTRKQVHYILVHKVPKQLRFFGR